MNNLLNYYRTAIFNPKNAIVTINTPLISGKNDIKNKILTSIIFNFSHFSYLTTLFQPVN